jgi:hypothetical protein
MHAACLLPERVVRHRRQSFRLPLWSRRARPFGGYESVASLTTTSPTEAQSAKDRLWGAGVVVALLAVIGGIAGVIRLLNPDPTVLATLALDKGAASTAVQLDKPTEVRVVLNVRALGKMDRGDLGDDLTRSQLTVTSSIPGGTARCSAFNGWSGSGSEEKRKQVPRFKEAENDCVNLKLAQGQSTITIALDWKGKSPRPTVTALVVVD